MKYLIHTIPKRLWYVEKYLVPSMIKKGIDTKNIYIFNDSNKRGNLQAFLDSLDYIENHFKKDKGVWHLQDDVIICKDFKKRTEEIKKDEVINGFVNKYYANVELSGRVNVKNYWYSFPCIYIPNKYIKGFMEWTEKVKFIAPYRRRYIKNRYDDWFFYKYLEEEHENDYMINLKPNLVDHIDYLIGGTTGTRKNKPVRAEYFKDLDLVKKLEMEVKHDLSQTNKENKKAREKK